MKYKRKKPTSEDAQTDAADAKSDAQNLTDKEIGGPRGPEPTRYGDWERKGRCVDF